MPSIRRVLVVAVVLGVASLGVTFLAAAKVAEKNPVPVEPAAGTPAIVAYGWVDVDGGIIPIFPKDFPNPSEIVEVLVKENQEVKKGDVLLRFNDELPKIRLEKAQAGLKQAEAGLKGATMAVEAQQFAIRTQTEIIEAKAFVASAVALEVEKAKKDLALRLPGVTSDDIKIGEEKLKALEKEVDVERRKLDAAKQFSPVYKQDEANGKIRELNATIAEVDYSMRFNVLKSDYDGTIVRSNAQPGMTFGPQTRQPPFLLLPKAPLIIRVEIDQEYAHRVTKGMSATIFNDHSTNLRWTGKVTQIPDVFLPKRPAVFGSESLLTNDNRILECHVTIDPTKDGAKLRVGQKVRVELMARE